jgi:hypothetical protein
MPAIDSIGAGTLWQIFKHTGSWLTNLARAGSARKQQSKQALRAVITAARETAVYMRQMDDKGARDHAVERRLAVLWTELGFQLEDLDLTKLAKRCQITGKRWANPSHYDDLFISRADVSLERMEQLARKILRDISA